MKGIENSREKLLFSTDRPLRTSQRTARELGFSSKIVSRSGERSSSSSTWVGPI